MTYQTVFNMKFDKGKAISPFPGTMSKNMYSTAFTVISVKANRNFDNPVYFYLNVSMVHPQWHNGPEVQNICRIGYFAKNVFNDNDQSLSLYMNNISTSLIITAKDIEGNILANFEGEMTVQIEGDRDYY